MTYSSLVAIPLCFLLYVFIQSSGITIYDVLHPGWLGDLHKSNGLARLKQVGLAANLYTVDHDGSFPPDMSRVRAIAKVVEPYLLGSHNGFESEVSRKNRLEDMVTSLNPGSPEYLGNATLSLVQVSSIPDQNKLLMFFDSAPWGDQRRNACVVDALARRVSEAEFQRAVENNWRLSP